MGHDRMSLPPEFFFDDSTSPKGYSTSDKGQGGYYSYYLQDKDLGVNTTVCFRSNKRISMVCYRCLKGSRGRFFSPDEVNYLLAVTSETSFKEVPLDYNFHCEAGLWKLYVSPNGPNGKTEATVGYTLESGKLEAFCVQIRSDDLKPSRVATCGGWID